MSILLTDTGDLSLYFDIKKVNKEQRTVTGIATADNVDTDGDVIDFAASIEAFSNWIGNIREMHQPKAVGKLLSFRAVPVSYNGAIYNGIEVTVYVSKGAQDTWEKVLDGTLAGFSIGGRVSKTQSEWDEETQTRVTRVLAYMLTELSLVDNPANPVGLISMFKMNKENVVEYMNELEPGEDGMAIEYVNADFTQGANGLYKGYFNTTSSGNIQLYETTKSDSGGEKNTMELHENTEGDIVTDMDELTETQRASITKKIGDFIFGGNEPKSGHTVDININLNKGIVDDEAVAEIVTEDTTTVDEEVEIEKSADETSTEISEEVEVEENGGETMELEDIMKALGSVLDEKLSAVKEEIAADVDTKIAELNKSVSETQETVEASIEAVNEEVSKVANSGATQKSIDTEDTDEVEEVITKSAGNASFWGGIFVPQQVCEHLGYES